MSGRDLPCPRPRLTRRVRSRAVESLSCTCRRVQREWIWAWDWPRRGAGGWTSEHAIDPVARSYLQQLFGIRTLRHVLDETLGHKVVKVVAPLVLLFQLGRGCARYLKQDAHRVHVRVGWLDLRHFNRGDAEGPDVRLSRGQWLGLAFNQLNEYLRARRNHSRR